jgi:hypothetical protein
MTAPSDTQTFHLKRRGTFLLQGAIFLAFGVSCAVQTFMRFGETFEQFWNTWWFLGILALGFLYLTAESLYKFFYNRIVFTPAGFEYYDFLKVTRVPWEQVQRIGELTSKNKKAVDFGLVLKDTAIENPNLLSLPFVSLVPFFSSWNDSPLRQWLKENQPRLLK